MSQYNTIIEYVEYASERFEQSDLFYGHGTDNAWDEAVSFVCFVCQLPPDVSSTVANQALTAPQKIQLAELTNLRIKTRKPAPYLTHQCWFAGLSFYVDERVIIPRSPIAEIILNAFQPWLKQQPARILDMCTGSACIAIACAKYNIEATVDAVDISTDALTVAKHNVLEHQLTERVRVIESDLFSQLKGKQYDVIIANPPYVSSNEYKTLPEEYFHEPKLALVSKSEGFELPDKILRQASQHLNPNGILLLEVGYGWKEYSKKHSKKNFNWITFNQGGEGVLVRNFAELERDVNE